MISHVEYDQIVKAVKDRDGNLRLYRRRRSGAGWSTRQVVFHPAGEWKTVQFDAVGVCTVGLAPPGDVPSRSTREEA